MRNNYYSQQAPDGVHPRNQASEVTAESQSEHNTLISNNKKKLSIRFFGLVSHSTMEKNES